MATRQDLTRTGAMAAVVAATAITAGVVTSLTIGTTDITASKAAQISVVAASVTETALLDDGNAPAAGYIYRFTGASNVVIKAQGDTAAHAASLAGIGHATLGVAPLSLPTTLVMDGACTPGLPVYLSAATPGVGTHTASALGLVPLFNAKRNVSLLTDASPNYLCEVVPFAPLVGHTDQKSFLDLETAQDWGVAPDQVSSFFDDFQMLETIGSDSNFVTTRHNGWGMQHVAPQGTASLATIYEATGETAGFRSKNNGPPATICGSQWRMSARFASTGSTYNTFIGVEGNVVSLLAGFFAGDSNAHFSYSVGSGGAYAGSTPGGIVRVAAKTTTLTQFDIESNGLSQARFRIGGPTADWSSWISVTGTNAAGSLWEFGSYRHSAHFDWIYLAVKRP